jgi:hypothetical protein
VTKRTPLEKQQKLRERAAAEVRTEMEKNVYADAEKTVQALSDPDLSFDERLQIFKTLQAWPRIVLGLYRAELAIVRKERSEKGAPEYGREKPSEIARYAVGDALGLGPDRVRELCKEGLRHLNQGMPPKPEITVAQFKQILSEVVAKDVAAAHRESFSKRKEQFLSSLTERLRAGKPIV